MSDKGEMVQIKPNIDAPPDENYKWEDHITFTYPSHPVSTPRINLSLGLPE